jgi:hypothetical protein
MVEAQAAVQQKQGRPFSHGETVRHQLGTLDIKKQTQTVHEHVHGLIFVPPRRLDTSHIFGILTLSVCCAFDVTQDSFVRQKCHPDLVSLPAP